MSIDPGTRKRLILGLLSNWISKLAGTFIQLIQVPFFLHFWSEPVFGNWLNLNAIPSYLSFSNNGFGTVAGNDITMSIARDDRDSALRTFQSCWWLIVLVMVATAVIVAALLALTPVATLLKVHYISAQDTRWIIAFLGVAVLVGQLEQLLQAAYRSVGRYPYGSFIKSCMTISAFVAMLIPVGLGYGPRTAALVFAAVNVAGTLLLMVLVRRDIAWVRYGWSYASVEEIRRLARPAFAFMGFPMGNALNLQGTLLAISYILGPLAVVVFSTARTVSRVALQMVQMVNNTFEPEFSTSFARNNAGLVRTLHRRACQMALVMALAFVVVMIAGGPWFLHHWTHGKVPPSRGLLSILLIVVVFYSLWNTSSAIMRATNQHERLAGIFVAASGVCVLLTLLTARLWGLDGAAGSLVLCEMTMCAYVLPRALRIVDDTFPEFARALLDVPPTVRPRALLRRLRLSRPALES